MPKKKNGKRQTNKNKIDYTEIETFQRKLADDYEINVCDVFCVGNFAISFHFRVLELKKKNI